MYKVLLLAIIIIPSSKMGELIIFLVREKERKLLKADIYRKTFRWKRSTDGIKLKNRLFK